jgi:hypothetical protein
VDGVIVVRIFYNPNGFPVPCTSSLLPNGTLVSPCPHYYAIQLRTSGGVQVRWLDFEGGGYHLNVTDLTTRGTAFVSHWQAPDVWRGGDALSVAALVCRARTARCDVLDLGLRTVEEVDWPPE